MLFGSIPERATASLIAIAARSSGRIELSAPPYRPMGVRTAATMAARLLITHIVLVYDAETVPNGGDAKRSSETVSFNAASRHCTLSIPIFSTHSSGPYG